MSSVYADIIIDISCENLDRTFQYAVPDELCEKVNVGSRVIVPFGRGNKETAGFVLEMSDKPKISLDKIKPILDVTKDDSLVEQKLLSLAYWMKTRYGSTMNQSLKTVLPLKKSVKEVVKRTVVLKLDCEEAAQKLDFYKKKHQVARYRLLSELIDEKELDYRLVTSKLNISAATIKAMCEQHIIDVEEKRVYRKTINGEYDKNRVNLLDEQRSVVDDFSKDYDDGIRKTYLLFGVTGSGKTEVYMEMIDKVIKSGESVIVLIPEISLTYQTVMRFYKRFGDRVSTLHSKLSDGEKYDQFERARKGEIDIIIGPRSALFTPFKNVGLIVIDEEHEHTYKSDQMPKYHARDVAIELARLHNASVVLGSATPDISTYNKAVNGEYKLYTLSKRAKGARLPKAEIVDLRQELANGNKSIFSEKLRDGISKRLMNNEQVMLFLNRRGYAGFVSCRACGEAIKCPHCDVALSAHNNGKLKCHYCGYEQQNVKICPKCGSKYVGGMRAGTQQVEEQLKKLYPYANILRMDRDTTSKKGDYEAILSSFANHEADILVGTQMIVKGHDFPYVTLVGILAADMSLNSTDYMAAERTYQLVVQAAGRAGRGQRPGEVIVQTYQPEHYSIESSIKQNYVEFYEEEIGYRSIMGYPPVGHMLAVLVESSSDNIASEVVASLAGSMKNDIIKDTVVIGPSEATIKKINDIYRYVIYVKSRQIELLIECKNRIEALVEANGLKDVRVTFDLDPMNGY